MPRSVWASLPDRVTGRSRRVAGAIGAIAAAALAIGLIGGLGLPGSSQGASQPARSSGSTTVQRRDLVATDTESGTLSYAHPHTVFNRLSGTVTALPAVGQVIRTGQSLYQVDGAPVILFDGTTPAYRDLTSGVGNGSDVAQLNRNLVKLGFDPGHQIAVDNTWQAATTTAVDSWQASLGEAQTGTVALGQIVFLPGQQRVSSVNTVLGSTGGSGAASSGSTATGASTKPVAPGPEFVRLTTTTAVPSASPALSGSPATAVASCPAGSSKAAGGPVCCPTARPRAGTPPKATTPAARPAACKPTSSSAQTVAALIALLKAETLELGKSKATPTGASGGASGGAGGGSGTPALSSARSGGSASGAGAASPGSAGAAATGGGSAGGGSAAAGTGTSSATAILGTTSTRLVVTVSLDATKQSEATVGEPVTVQLPNGNTVDGEITEVSPVAQTASSSSTSSTAGGGGASASTPSATVPITITLNGRHPDVGLDQAAVSVNFQQQVANHVLSVPVTALLATAGGGYSVQEAQAPHQLIPVTTGLFAAGYVQISGSQIYSGLQVTDSQG